MNLEQLLKNNKFTVQTTKDGLVEFRKGKPQALDHYAYYVFVQPADEAKERAVSGAVEVIRTLDNALAQVLPLENMEWQIPEREKLAVAFKTEGDALEFARKLAHHFGIEAYLIGSAADVIKGEYSRSYGAGFTHQVNPLIHLRRGTLELHEIFWRMQQGSTADHTSLRRYFGDMELDEGVIYNLAMQYVIPEKEINKLVNESLANAGILQLVVSIPNDTGGKISKSFVLDPRVPYDIGRGDSKSNDFINLIHGSVSRKHAHIHFNVNNLNYMMSDIGTDGKGSRNGTFIRDLPIQAGVYFSLENPPIPVRFASVQGVLVHAQTFS